VKFTRKKIVSLLICVVAVFALDRGLFALNFFVSGRNMERFENQQSVEMQVRLDGETAYVQLINNSDDDKGFGEEFTLYRRFGWRWRRVFFRGELREGVFWRSIAFLLPANGHSTEVEISLYHRFDGLRRGEYRIVKDVFFEDTGPRGDNIRVAGGFTVH